MRAQKESWLDKLWHPGVLATLLLVASLVLMGLVVLIAGWLGEGSSPPQPAAITINAGSEQPRKAETPSYAAERPASSSGGFSWPSSPSRRPAQRGGDGGGAGGGLSESDYKAAVESGKTVYLPNPSGECNLAGGGADALSADALANCFSKQAKTK